MTRFSTGVKFGTFCLSVRVTATGKARNVAMVRKPYSDRPRRGGGKAVPDYAMNPRGPGA